MKSLLLKDVLVLLRQSRLFTLLTVLLALCSGFKPEVLQHRNTVCCIAAAVCAGV